jgi:hypothetical protein
MNDTEDAVRHLFTVATQDIPPGINLGHDVLAARRRRVVRARVVLSAGLAAIVAAATVITLSAVSPPSALAQITDGGAELPRHLDAHAGAGAGSANGRQEPGHDHR